MLMRVQAWITHLHAGSSGLGNPFEARGENLLTQDRKGCFT